VWFDHRSLIVRDGRSVHETGFSASSNVPQAVPQPSVTLADAEAEDKGGDAAPASAEPLSRL
jgi:hypothetical protein